MSFALWVLVGSIQSSISEIRRRWPRVNDCGPSCKDSLHQHASGRSGIKFIQIFCDFSGWNLVYDITVTAVFCTPHHVTVTVTCNYLYMKLCIVWQHTHLSKIWFRLCRSIILPHYSGFECSVNNLICQALLRLTGMRPLPVSCRPSCMAQKRVSLLVCTGGMRHQVWVSWSIDNRWRTSDRDR